MVKDKLQISDLIDYVGMLLNFEIKGKLIYLDVVESLEAMSDLAEFRKELKGRVGNLNDDYKYLNGFQKFIKIVEDYNKKKLALTQKENIQIEDFKTKLYNKLTDICEEIRRDKIPTVEYIKSIDFNNIKNFDKTMYFEPKEIKVNNILGDSLELYRLSTQNKPLLQEKIREIILDLVNKKKTDTVAIVYENNPVIKLMNKGK